MDQLLNHLRGQASQLDHGWAQPRIGVVSSVDANSYSARVLIQPEGVLSGWLPILSSWIGNGWGLCSPPLPGDQVLIVWQDGDAEQGVIAGRLWSGATPSPATPAGELWIVHKTGSFIKLHNDGTLESQAPMWTHHGNLAVTGDVSDGHGTLSRLRGHYDAHIHPPGNSPPVPTD